MSDTGAAQRWQRLPARAAPFAVGFHHRDFSSDLRIGCTSEERWEIIKHSTEVVLDDEGLLNHQWWKEAIWERKRRQIFLSTEGVHFQKHRDVTVSQPKIYLKWVLSLPKKITAGTIAEAPCYSAEVVSASFLITINCVLRWKLSWAFISSFQRTIIFCNLWQIEKNSAAAWKVSDLSSVAYLTW